jgi:branched-chain amino acid transport system substrate-binding protein
MEVPSGVSQTPAAAPVLVGVLYDFPQADGGALFEEALRLGIGEVAARGRLDREIELMARQSRGLPAGTAHDVEVTFGELVDTGALAVIGPSVSDNGLVVRDLADRAGVPCINYTGGEQTRSRFMFHYQVGSLQEEPVVMAHYVQRAGHETVGVVHDHSPVGRAYAEAFAEACAHSGLETTGSAAVPPLADDISATVGRLRTTRPDCLVYLGLGVAARALSVALSSEGWTVPVVSNSALMFGYARRDWRPGWEGWVYVDTLSDENSVRAKLAGHAARAAAGPIGVAAYDMGRLLAEGVARASHLTRDGLREALENVKQLPAASGMDGTTMGFGAWDHGALKGRYLVLRSWRDGKSVQVKGR